MKLLIIKNKYWVIEGCQTKAATGGVLQKILFLNISQNSQENTFARVSFNKVAGFSLQLY